MKNLRIIIILILGSVYLLLATSLTYAQDTTWQQVLGGWVDDVYYENLFLGGSYYTRISLADIDNDGDLDMFYGGGSTGSLILFENIGNSNVPQFVLSYEEFPGLRSTTTHGRTVDVDFADLDADQDYDAAISLDLDQGGGIAWNDGNAQWPIFVPRPPLGPLQGQSNVTLIDIDNDGDFDYFSGQGYRNTQIYFSENVGTPYSPIYNLQTYHYQDLDLGVPFNFDFGDIDEDGDYDLIVCKHGGNIAYYKNIGTPQSAEFELVTNDFLPHRDTTDWMETPELADIDADGDLDLFLAGAYAHLFFFENLGIGVDPQYVERSDTSFLYLFHPSSGSLMGNSVDIDGDGDDDIMPGRSILVNESDNDQIRFNRIDNSIPFNIGWFSDMDSDGDFDYLAGTGANAIIYWENIGDHTWPVWAQYRYLFPPDGFLGNVWAVATGDLDNDGDQDLLVGHTEGNNGLTYYRNDGTPQNYDFSYIGENVPPGLGYLVVVDLALEDIDIDGDLDLLLGDLTILDGNDPPVRFLYYRNDGSPDQPLWTFITDDFQNIIRDHRNGAISICLSDVNRDGSKDLFVSVNFGLQLFLNPEIQTDVWEDYPEASNLPRKPFTIQCYPNPFNSAVTIGVANAPTAGMVIEIYDILGRFQESLNIENNSAIWNAAGYSSGVYFARVKSPGNIAVRKLLYLK